MLRTSLLIAALLALLGGGGLLAVMPTAFGVQCILGGALVAGGLLIERWRYELPEHRALWQRTGEAFLDPSTGERVEVLYDPQTGHRKYLERAEEPMEWEPTGEIFFDPVSGKRMEVQLDRRSGERLYLESPEETE